MWRRTEPGPLTSSVSTCLADWIARFKLKVVNVSRGGSKSCLGRGLAPGVTREPLSCSGAKAIHRKLNQLRKHATVVYLNSASNLLFKRSMSNNCAVIHERFSLYTRRMMYLTRPDCMLCSSLVQKLVSCNPSLLSSLYHV